MIKTWTMRDGDQILIEDMDDSHLNNTIKLIDRSVAETPLLKRRLIPYKEAMLVELKKRMFKDLLEDT
jgi:hypothetical protein